MPGDLREAEAIAAHLEGARRVARKLFGPTYEACVAPWKAHVHDLARAWGCRPIEVPPRLEREKAMPPNPLLLFAAVVELIEEADRG